MNGTIFKLRSPTFLQAVSDFMQQHPDAFQEWLTPTGCVFQDAGHWTGTSRIWIKATPAEMKTYLDQHPRATVLCALIGNCRKSFSRCKLANIRLKLCP
jgi:hypothetical protein